MAGEVRLRIDSMAEDVEVEGAAYQTSFIKFYSSMIETPVLGDQYNYYVPGSILILSLIFLLLSYFNFESKVVRALKRYNNEQETGDSSNSMLDNARIAVSTPASEAPAAVAA